MTHHGPASPWAGGTCHRVGATGRHKKNATSFGLNSPMTLAQKPQNTSLPPGVPQGPVEAGSLLQQRKGLGMPSKHWTTESRVRVKIECHSSSGWQSRRGCAALHWTEGNMKTKRTRADESGFAMTLLRAYASTDASS